MSTRRAVILGLGGAVGSVAFMLGLGAWRTRNVAPTDPLLPLPVTAMDWTLTTIAVRLSRPQTGSGGQ